MEKHLSRHTYGVLCCIAGAVSWGISGAISEAFFQRYTADPAWVTAVRMTAAGIFLMVWVTAKKQLCFGDLMKDKKSLSPNRRFLPGRPYALPACISQCNPLDKFRHGNGAPEPVHRVRRSLSLHYFKKEKPAGKTDPYWHRTGAFRRLADFHRRNPGQHGTDPQRAFLGSGRGPRRRQLLPSTSRRPVERWGSLPVTGMGMLIGGLVLSAAVRAWEIPAGLDLYALVLLSAIVLLGTVGAFSLFLQGIRMAGPMKASLLSCLEPLTAAFLSAFWLHSSFSAAELVGFACILATVFLIRE